MISSSLNVHQNATDLPDGIEVPGLPALLNPGGMCARINEQLPAGATPFEQCHIANLRFKTPANCLVSYTLLQRDPQSSEEKVTNLYARGFSKESFGPASAKALADRWVATEAGPSVTPLADLSAFLYWYPNDERLTGLRRVTVRKKLQREFHAHLPAYPPDEWRVSDRSIRLRLVRHQPTRPAGPSC